MLLAQLSIHHWQDPDESLVVYNHFTGQTVQLHPALKPLLDKLKQLDQQDLARILDKTCTVHIASELQLPADELNAWLQALLQHDILLPDTARATQAE